MADVEERQVFSNSYDLDQDPERVPRFRQLPARRLVHSTALYRAEELKTSRTYNELLPRAGMQDSLNVKLPGLAGSHIGWTLNDPVDSEGWGSSRITMVQRLLPHIQQFVRVRQVLAGAAALGASGGARRPARHHRAGHHPVGQARADRGGERQCPGPAAHR